MARWLVSLGYLSAFLAPLVDSLTFYLIPWPLVIITFSHVLYPTLVRLTVANATVGTATLGGWLKREAIKA